MVRQPSSTCRQESPYSSQQITAGGIHMIVHQHILQGRRRTRIKIGSRFVVAIHPYDRQSIESTMTPTVERGLLPIGGTVERGQLKHWCTTAFAVVGEWLGFPTFGTAITFYNSSTTSAAVVLASPYLLDITVCVCVTCTSSMVYRRYKMYICGASAARQCILTNKTIFVLRLCFFLFSGVWGGGVDTFSMLFLRRLSSVSVVRLLSFSTTLRNSERHRQSDQKRNVSNGSPGCHS